MNSVFDQSLFSSGARSMLCIGLKTESFSEFLNYVKFSRLAIPKQDLWTLANISSLVLLVSIFRFFF